MCVLSFAFQTGRFMASSFPTRSYPYRKAGLAIESADPPAPVAPGRVFGFRIGVETQPIELAPAEVAALGDPLAVHVLAPGHRPLTTDALLALLDGAGVLLERRSFLVAEGGQVRHGPQTAELDRGFRFVIAGRTAAGWDLMISTAAPFDNAEIFLQVMAWDAGAGAFAYYERRGGSWIRAGSSHDALADATRGRGPFDSHVNGGMVMKELKLPWLHWHSLSQTIGASAFAPGEPLLDHPLFVQRRGAQELETIVRGGIDRWTRARLDRALDGPGRIARPDWLMRHVLTATSANVAAAPVPYDGPDDIPIPIPPTFLFDSDVLLDLLGIDLAIARPPQVTRGRYRAAAARIGLRLQNGPFRQEGDAFFAWPIPERAFEDVHVIDHLLRRRWLSRRTAAALTMMDYTNPLGSPRRAALMRHVSAGPTAPEALEPELLTAILAAPETDAALAADLQLPEAEWPGVCAARIAAYVAAVQAAADTDAGLDALMALADSRRRAFRTRKIAEFDMTLPWTDIAEHAPLLRIEPDGSVRPDPPEEQRP